MTAQPSALAGRSGDGVVPKDRRARCTSCGVRGVPLVAGECAPCRAVLGVAAAGLDRPRCLRCATPTAAWDVRGVCQSCRIDAALRSDAEALAVVDTPLPCGTPSARRRHWAHGQECQVCGTSAGEVLV